MNTVNAGFNFVFTVSLSYLFIYVFKFSCVLDKIGHLLIIYGAK